MQPLAINHPIEQWQSISTDMLKLIQTWLGIGSLAYVDRQFQQKMIFLKTNCLNDKYSKKFIIFILAVSSVSTFLSAHVKEAEPCVCMLSYYSCMLIVQSVCVYTCLVNFVWYTQCLTDSSFSLFLPYRVVEYVTCYEKTNHLQ